MKRVLVVDDERLTADTLGLIFRKHGFDARVAYSVEEALACAREFDPQLILCDISMPGQTGLDLMSVVSDELPECLVLVLTGYYSNLHAVREQFRRMPQRTSLLTKPCRPEDLLREVSQLLARAPEPHRAVPHLTPPEC